MATPLPLSTQIDAYPVCETAIWVAFLIFLKGLMRVIIIFGTRKWILMIVEMSQIFLFNYCYCKIADFDPRKGRFKRKKWKDVQPDGTLSYTKISQAKWYKTIHRCSRPWYLPYIPNEFLPFSKLVREVLVINYIQWLWYRCDENVFSKIIL